MRTALDTNVLLDFVLQDPRFGQVAKVALTQALGKGEVLVCPVVYAELAPQFGKTTELDRLLDDLSIRLDGFDRASLHLAGQAWRRYARERGKDVECPHCGHRHEALCPSCQGTIAWRQHLVPDFLIGAHASTQADALMTRDPGYYRTYYPALTLEVPKPAPNDAASA